MSAIVPKLILSVTAATFAITNAGFDTAAPQNARLAISTCFGNTIYFDIPGDPEERHDRKHSACHVLCSQARKVDGKPWQRKPA